jgi:hypothetical protein
VGFFLQCELLREDFANTRSRTEELQVLAKEEAEQKEKIVKELKSVEISVQELRSSLAEHEKIHEEFIQQVTKDKVEIDEELKMAKNQLHMSNANYDCTVQV